MSTMTFSPLAKYFRSKKYLRGEQFAHEEYEWNTQEDVIVHKKTGIKTWSLALDKRSPTSTKEEWIVLFHYTNETGFRLITDVSRQENVELFASREAQKDSNFGPGLYATDKAPDAWEHQDHVLMNNYYPAAKTWKAEAGATQAMPAWRSPALQDYVLRKHAGKAEYCVAVVCDRDEAINAMAEPTRPPAVPTLRKTAHNVWGDREHPERNVWVVGLWSFEDGRPKVDNLTMARNVIGRVVLRRLNLKLQEVAPSLKAPQWPGSGELLTILTTLVDVDWVRLAELCGRTGVHIPPLVDRMKVAAGSAKANTGSWQGQPSAAGYSGESGSSSEPKPAEANEEAARIAAEQRKANEEAARIAAEQRKANEEAARIAAEQRKANEEAARIAAEQRKANEEAARIAAEQRKAAETAQQAADAAAAAKYQDQRNDPAVLQAAKQGDIAAVRHLLRTDRAAARRADEDGETALHYAAYYDRAELVAALAAAGAELEATTRQYRRTPLHVAASNGSAAAVAQLLELRASVHAVTSAGWTPLHYAAYNGKLQAAQLLVGARADVRAKNNSGQTALDVARGNRQSEVVRLLEDAARR